METEEAIKVTVEELKAVQIQQDDFQC